MWPMYLFSLLVACTAVPINRDFSTNNRPIYVDKSNEKFGNESVCVSDDVLYKEGDMMPTINVCERCTCKPPRFVCQDIKCEVKPGCRVAQRPNACCPVYQCECERDGKLYQNGERLEDVESPCQACYCQSGEIVCTIIECYRRHDCHPRYVNGTCCPKYDHCPPLEPTPMALYTSTSRQQDDTPQHNLQDNAVDSSKRIDILGEIMSDSPYLAAPVSFQQYDDEILEENMSEVHTERSTVTLQSDALQDNGTADATSNYEAKTSTNGKNQESHEQNLQDNTAVESETEKTMDNDDTIPDITQILLKHEPVETEMTTASAEESTDPADTMLGDEQPSQYAGEIKQLNSDKSPQTSNESFEETSKELSTTNKDNIVTTKYKDSEESSNESVEKSIEDETETTPSMLEGDEIPVLNIKSDVSAENMSIVIPQLITSKMGYEEGSSLVRNDPHTNDESEEVTTHFEQVPNKTEEERNADDSAEGNNLEMMHDDPVLENKLNETTSIPVFETKIPNDMEEISTEREEILTTSQSSDDNIIKTDIETGTTSEVTETTEIGEIVSTTPNVLEGEHPGNRRSDISESESTSEISNRDDVPSTTPNVSEDEHLGLTESDSTEKETINNDEISSTMPEGEHSENRRYGSSDTTSSDEALLTTPNVLEGEHPEARRSDSYEATDTTSSDEALLTTPNVLEGEHPETRSDSYEATDTTSSDEALLTTPNVLEGEHPETRRSDSFEAADTTSSDEALLTTLNVLEGEHPETRRSDSSEAKDTTSSDEALLTTANVLEGEHPGNRSNDEQSTETTTDYYVSSTMPNFLEGEHPNSRLEDLIKSTDTPSSTTTDNLGDDSHTKEIASGELSEPGRETEVIVSDVSESRENITPQSSEKPTSTEEMTTYSSTAEVTTTNWVESSVKILPPLPLINKTLSGEIMSDKGESLPENWLKLQEVSNSIKTADNELLAKEEIKTESNSAEITTEVPTITSTLEHDEHSEKHEILNDETTVTSSREKGEVEQTTATSSAETEMPTEELYQWANSEEKTDSNKYERHTLQSKEEPVEIKPIYVENYVSSGSNEQMFSTAEIYGDYYVSSKENNTLESNDELTQREADLSTESTSTEVPSEEVISSSMEEEVSSNENTDSFLGETTTVFSNNTETTTNRNDTETTTARSFNDSNYNEIDVSSSETLNSQNKDTYVKEVHDYGSKLNHGDYYEDRSLVLE